MSRFGQPGIDIAAAALQELAKAGVPADNIVSSRPRVNAATQYLSEDEELAGICAADGEGDPKLSERFNKIRRSCARSKTRCGSRIAARRSPKNSMKDACWR